MNKIRSALIPILLAAPLAAAVPNRITYQGRLTKSGVSAAGSHKFIACLTNGSGNLWCDPGQTLNLPVSGDFTLILQPTIPIDWVNNAVKLQLKVDGQDLSPADDFTSVPYALVAASAAYASQAVTAQTASSLAAPLPSSQVQLNGLTTLDTWQSTTTPTMINAAKIDGSLTGQWNTAPGNVLYYNGGSVGIGTAIPSSKLTLFTPNDGAGDAIQIHGASSSPTKYAIFNVHDANEYVRLGYYNGTSMKNIFLDGNVGIGTTAPAYGLDTHFNDGFVGWVAKFQSTNSTNNGAVLLGSRAANSGAIQAIDSSAGVRNLSINPDGGNVGIGTNAPTQTLTVNGSFTYSMAQHDMTSSRVLGTVYQNTTGRIMYVSVLTTSNNGTASADCDANSSPTTPVSVSSTLAGYSRTNFFIVVPGYRYKVFLDTLGSLLSWIEWY